MKIRIIFAAIVFISLSISISFAGSGWISFTIEKVGTTSNEVCVSSRGKPVAPELEFNLLITENLLGLMYDNGY